MYLSRRMQRLEDEIFAALNERRLVLERQGKKIYNLSIGTPDFVPPAHVKEALIEAARDDDNWKYALRDTPELLESLCDYYADRFGVKITPDMVTSCSGSQEGLGHIGMALCDEGDTVLLPTPCYPAFISGAVMAGAVPHYYELTAENGFLPDVSSIPDDVADRARYMIFSLPSNPAGSVGDDRIYEEIISFAKKHDIVVIHDNAYSDIIFDGFESRSFLSYEGAADVGIEFFSLSKSFNVTGARISFCIGNPEIIAAFRKLRSQYDFGMFLPIQKAASAALRGDRKQIEHQRKLYEERRDALCSGLRAIGWNVPDSHGSMFVWAPLPDGYSNSMDFSMELMDRTGIVCTPGASFGPLGEGYVRFALVLPPEAIREAVDRIKESGILK
ncbi:MAG: aminotransferase class I/II-fold pyridoxal phosphate-dependent enzyme [Clostridiales bacterium]|nr:aminotransferase class I/II-fold pyridoxal phosphate-dependent enzyme [Clostridiales bacterium]